MAITKVKTLGITDANVTAAKLSTDSVETAKITASNVTNAKLGSDISAAKLTAGTVDNARLPSTISDKTVQATTPITIKGDGSSADGKLILNCSQNSHGVSIAAPPHSAAQSYNLVLPSTAPGANKILQTDGSGNLSWVDAGGGKINQYQYTVQTAHTQSSTTTGTWIDVTGLSVAITPSATNSVIIIRYQLVMCNSGGEYPFSRVQRDIGGAGYGDWNYNKGLDDSSINRVSGAMGFTTSNDQVTGTMESTLKDSTHNTTSEITYKLQFISGGGTFKVNRCVNATTGAGASRSISWISAMEVLA